MKLRMTVRFYAVSVILLNQTSIDNTALNSINFASLQELRTILLLVATKYLTKDKLNIDKKVSKEIPDSYGLLFFREFNGLQIDGFERIVVKDICRQIEKQLYKSGKYNFEKP
jgi:hypothetical protein